VMPTQLAVTSVLALLGVGFLAAAVVHERRMHGHRRPGVSYKQATLRRGGGWRRGDLFTEVGLYHQQRASLYGITGAALLIASILAWIVLGTS
jgi:hypothetical protein